MVCSSATTLAVIVLLQDGAGCALAPLSSEIAANNAKQQGRYNGKDTRRSNMEVISLDSSNDPQEVYQRTQSI
jgi:hypothetical protein